MLFQSNETVAILEPIHLTWKHLLDAPYRASDWKRMKSSDQQTLHQSSWKKGNNPFFFFNNIAIMCPQASTPLRSLTWYYGLSGAMKKLIT
jgi:hypothetical protein